MKNKWKILVITVFVVMSTMVMMPPSFAAGNHMAPPPSTANVTLGNFTADQQVKAWGAFPSEVAKYMSGMFGINPAYQVGAVDSPYTFLIGDFFMNGQNVSQDVQVHIAVNLNSPPIPYDDDDAPQGGIGTMCGAPMWGWGGLFEDSFGIAFTNYPVQVRFIQNNKTVVNQNITLGTSGNSWFNQTVTFVDPWPVTTGPFYIVFYFPYFSPEPVGGDQFLGYIPLLIGEGQYLALNAHVTGKPTSVVNSGVAGASAFLNWSFNAGEWNVTFVHYLDNNPSDTSPSNIQVLQWDNFTFAQTGGIKHLRYNFSSSAPSGVYGWRFHEGITDYGTSFIVYNNVTVQQSGDKPPMISIQFTGGHKQGGNTNIIISGKDAKNSTIYLEISVWFGNDMYTVPNPSYENVLYYFVPEAIPSGGNYTLSITDNFYGELNVEVISHNIYNEWNNSYASFTITSIIYSNSSGGNYVPPAPWFVNPFAGPLNALFFIGGIALLLWSIHRSGISSQVVRRAMRGMAAPNGGIYLPTHYMAAFLLIILAFVNWAAVFALISTWGGGLP